MAGGRLFGSLQGRNYRLFFIGQLVSVSGTWMQQVAQDWLVLQLTGRALPVGITTALQFLPVALIGVWGGVVADRFDKRRVLMIVQAVSALLALVLGLLTLTGVVELWMVYALAFLLGMTTAFDIPTRHAFVAELVGPERVTNAIGLNSALFNSARVIGPSLAGITIVAFGLAWSFLINAASYLAVLVALWLMDPAALHRAAPTPRAPGQIRAGLRYVWSSAVLRSTLLLVAVVGTIGLNYRVILPLLARFTFNGGPRTYGLMTSVMAVGSVVGALMVAGRSRPSRRMLLGSAGAFGVATILAAVAPTLGLELLVLAPVGLTTLTFLATANATLQLGSSPEMRGRVMAIYGIVLIGSTPIGGVLTGWLAETHGPRAPLWVSGSSCVLAALASVALLRRARQRGEARPEEAVLEPPAAHGGGQGAAGGGYVRPELGPHALRRALARRR